MANLFFIHTPFQLLVAQQIIYQEHLTDNIMLYGYVGSNKHFLESYKLTAIDSFWSKRILFADISSWALIHRQIFFIDAIKTYFNYKRLKAIISDNNVSSLFLSDINNVSYKFTMMLFHRRGYKISIFEEGSSHYFYINYPSHVPSRINRLLSKIMDSLYFRPLFKMNWGWNMFCNDLEFDKLPIDERYSLIPNYHEKFDKVIQYKPLLSEKLKNYINEETKFMNFKGALLLMTSPIYEVLKATDKEYIEIIESFISNLSPNSNLYVKFHPREKENIKEIVEENLKRRHIHYVVISKNITIPIEYYLQVIHFDEIVCFFTSTSMYNGYLFPHTKFTYLVSQYYQLCKERHISNLDKLDKYLNAVS